MADIELDDELVREYLAESREHLATIENDLLAMEAAGEVLDEQLVNRVFRAAHSIKGGAGFFGLRKIRDLAHRIENVLDMVRSRMMTADAEVINILLVAFDKLRDLLATYRTSDEADITEFLDALTTLTAAYLPADQKHCVLEQVTVPTAGRHLEVSAFDLNQARRGGKLIYLIEYDLIHDVQRQGRTPLDVFKSLVQCGTILETCFDLISAGTLDDEPSNQMMWEVLYATVLEPDLIRQLVRVPADRIRVIEKDGAKKSLTAAAPVIEPSAPEPEPAPQPEPARAMSLAPPVAATPVAESTIRLNVSLLDSLVTLAGELVLSRNHLSEALTRGDGRAIRAGAQRVGAVTSELQEVILLTRLQPVGNLFARFPRLVRDMARDLKKEVRLDMAGSDVEIDKTILEGLSDPLTHMVRNAVDHGIESPEARVAAGKPSSGAVALRAYQQAGHVVIEIADDGKGIDAARVAASAVAKGLVSQERAEALTEREKIQLIFLPGLSTAEKVTGISGRGVGMDVVKTNLERLGGKVEIDSRRGLGSCFRIKLPLTLAILPSLLVSCGEDRFAIPQVNVKELIRIPAAQIARRTDRVGTAEVLILRDRLLPLVHLAETIGAPPQDNAGRAMNIVVVDAGSFEYGLVVRQLHTTAEIVVKPLGRRAEKLREYAGATILGDGRVAPILDVAGVAALAGLTAATAEAITAQSGEDQAAAVNGERHTFLLFQNGPNESCALSLDLVARVERVQASQIEYLGGRRTMQYRGASLPLVALRDTANVQEIAEDARLVVIVIESGGRPVGMLGAEPLDVVETELAVDTIALRQPGIAGSAIIKGRTTLLVDVFELAGLSQPSASEPEKLEARTQSGTARAVTVLLAEDSSFFRGQVRRFLESAGYRVKAAEDGQEAWELLEHHGAEIQVVATDIEMPRLDGLGLTRRIRADKRFSALPVIALTSLADDDDIARGLAAGVSEYQVKLNQEDLLKSIRGFLASSGPLQKD